MEIKSSNLENENTRHLNSDAQLKMLYEAKLMYCYSLATPYYLRNHQFIDSQEKSILNIGCSQLDKLQILAAANPGTKIVSIDVSAEAIKLAEQTCRDRGLPNIEFQVLAIEDIPRLGWKFDYINCDENLYFFAQPAINLQVMKSVLKPQGIIRANLISARYREELYRVHKAWQILGLTDHLRQATGMAAVREVLNTLKDNIRLNQEIKDWQRETALLNDWSLSDRACEIPDMFAAIAQAELEFISMVNGQQWNLLDLFAEPDNLPAFWALSLPAMPAEEQLHVFELLHPIHRLLDFWCGHPQQEQPLPTIEWTQADWERARVYMHPQLKTVQFQAAILNSIAQMQPLDLSQYLPMWERPVVIESTIAACLLPLQSAAQEARSLCWHWRQLRPIDPATLAPIDEADAFESMQQILIELETCGCVLLELSP